MATNDLINTEWWKTSGTTTPAVGAGLMSAPPVAAPTITPTGYDPAATALNPKTDTVAGQIDTIVGADSPIMQRAATRADQQMNKRGLMNSSMAVGAGQTAVMDAALPIAQQDASTFATINRENTAATNNQRQFTAGATNTAAAQTAQLGTQVDLANAGNVQQANMARADLDQRTTQFNASQANDLLKLGMDITNKQALANTEASYKVLMQGNQSASEIYKQAIKNITDVMSSQTMDQAAKNTAVSNQVAMLSKGLEITGAMANLNLAQYLDFSSVPA